MKGSLVACTVAALIGFAAASPARRDACQTDACAQAIASATDMAYDCSSYFIYTITQSLPTVTTTYTPADPTTTIFTATVTTTVDVVSESLWPTTIESEVYNQNKRDATSDDVCPKTTITRSDIPTYATNACSAPNAYSSACACAGFTSTPIDYGCYTHFDTVYAPPTATITEFEVSTVSHYEYVTTTLSTPLVDTIRCNDIIQIDEDLPAYKIVCEAQSASNRTIRESLYNTDWDNCVERATFGDGAYVWEYDITQRACYIYTGGAPNTSAPVPRQNYVYAYIYNDQPAQKA